MLSIGIDLGGTNIAVGVVDEGGKIISRSQRRTGAERPYQQVIRDMAEAAKEAAEGAGVSISEVASVGVGVPGYYKQDTGIMVFGTNLGWRDVPLRAELEGHLGVSVCADNDANVAGYAEAVAGVSRSAQSSIFLTLGTGLGSGIIIDGKIWSGAHGVGGEIGHIMYQHGGILCTCGARGCLERYASATALSRIGQEAARRHPESGLAATPQERISAKTVIDLARTGDPAAVEAFDEYTTHLSNGIITIISFFDPEMIVLGGGVSHAGDFLLDPVREKVMIGRFYKSLPAGEVALAELGSDAGIIGAALLHLG